MKKIHTKLIAITLTLALALSVMVMATYAWFVLSGDPAVSGIQVAIAGGNTILVAADMTKVVDGVTYHYPGTFSDTMHFNQQPSYLYLNTLGGLTPVSTADGVNWFLPTYYQTGDPEVKNGLVPNGMLKNVEDFQLDFDMAHANLPADAEETIAEGSYVYLDFWVVSPSADFTLRLSTGDDSGGSFAVDLLQPEKTNDGYTLTEPESQGAAAVRVGFLANDIPVTDQSMHYYQNSISYQSQYTQLKGVYQDPRTGSSYADSSRFTIYEPNADSHPQDETLAGCYVPTYPVGLVNDVPTAVSVADRLTAQTTSRWILDMNQEYYAIEDMFQASLFDMDEANLEPEQMAEYFYNGYLQGQISRFVDKGSFVTKSSNLAAFSGATTAEQFASLDQSGATEDVYIIQLEKNKPQRIRMFIWLEGQDADCVDTVRSSCFAVNIELAGSNE